MQDAFDQEFGTSMTSDTIGYFKRFQMDLVHEKYKLGDENHCPKCFATFAISSSISRQII